MKPQNTTIQNRSKILRLSSEHVIPTGHTGNSAVVQFLKLLTTIAAPKEQILFSIGVSLLEQNGNDAMQKFLAEYDHELIELAEIPRGAFDLLGAAYQFLNSKHENLEKGSFYTGKAIAAEFVDDLDFDSGQVIFDPACGSASFLLSSNAPPQQIYGVDNDPLAIMIAKFNYFLKFPDADLPNLYCEDFFTWFSENRDSKCDYVITNPPYGANLNVSLLPTQHISSGESFSYFVEMGFKLLKVGGVLRYLVPEALLNIKRHTDVRDFILDHTNLSHIKKYSAKFAGVMSDTYMIQLEHQRSSGVLFDTGFISTVPKDLFRRLDNRVFVHLTEEDVAILEKVTELKRHSLADSVYGLGVVTGDNKTKLLSEIELGAEPIYTGKEVKQYGLLPAKHFLVFDRNNLQQVAPDEIYRAPAKLVYKVISDSLIFALDETGSLTTNSANIVIPRVPGYDIRTVMALLNSKTYSYLYLKLFGGVNKIGKEKLNGLPFPEISESQNSTIVELVKEVEASANDEDLQRFVARDLLGLTQAEINYIESCVRRVPRGGRPGSEGSRRSRSGSLASPTAFSMLSPDEKERFRAWADLPTARRIGDSRLEEWITAGRP